MSGLDPNAGGALVVPGGGASLPTASAAGELPVSDGAGSAYTATSAGDVVDAAIASVVGAVAGQAIVGDGLGGVTETSADVSAMLAAASAAAARTALGASGRAAVDAPFATGQGWTIVPSPAEPLGLVWSLEAGDIARCTLSTTGNRHDINGARIERAITWDGARRWRMRVTPVAATNTSGQCYTGICFRNAAGTRVRFLMMWASSSVLFSGCWADGLGAGGLTGPIGPVVAWNGTGTLELRISREGKLTYGVINASGGWTTVSTVDLPFAPSHVGLGAWCDGATVAVVDFATHITESFE